jgi:hypothetical protein
VDYSYEFCYKESVRAYSEFMQMVLMPPPETIRFLRDDCKSDRYAIQKMNSCIARYIDTTPAHMIDVRTKCNNLNAERFWRIHKNTRNQTHPFPSVFDTVYHPFVSDSKPTEARKRGAIKKSDDILGKKDLDKSNFA